MKRTVVRLFFLSLLLIDIFPDKLWEVQSRGIALLVGSFESAIASSLSHLHEGGHFSQTRGEGREGRLREEAHDEEGGGSSQATAPRRWGEQLRCIYRG